MQRSLDLQSIITSGGKTPLLLDGGLATELERHGLDLCDSLWSARVLLDAPEQIAKVHTDYLNAGADIIISASYQVSYTGFAARGLDHTQATTALQTSVRLACEARNTFLSSNNIQINEKTGPWVAASVGPYGAALADGSEFRGYPHVSIAELRAFHEERLRVLLDAQPDMIACETIPSLREAEVLAELLRKYATIPAWISVSCRDGNHTCEGQPIAELANLANSCPAIAAVGANCTDPRYITTIIKSLTSITRTPVVVYPNSGECWNPSTQQWNAQETVVDFTASARQWAAAGAHLMGGCCRTTPQHIAALRTAFSPAMEQTNDVANF